MQKDLLNDIRRLKNIIRAKKTHTALDKLHLGLLKRAETLLKNGDGLHAAELGIAVNALDKAALIDRKKLSEIRARYSDNCGDGVLDEMLERYFGKYILSEPLNRLSSALTMLRSALLDGNKLADEQIRGVRKAVAALPDEYSKLGRIIAAAADRAEYLMSLGETEHACDLIDAVHALPEIAGAPSINMRSYKRCFVQPFARKHNDDFFKDIDLSKIR